MQSNDGLAECLVEVSCLREVVSSKRYVEQWSSASFVECWDEPPIDSGGVHVTPCRQAGDDACLAGASRADDSSAQLKSERDTGSVVEPGMDDSKDKATPQMRTHRGVQGARLTSPWSVSIHLTENAAGWSLRWFHVGRVTLVHLGEGWNRHRVPGWPVISSLAARRIERAIWRLRTLQSQQSCLSLMVGRKAALPGKLNCCIDAACWPCQRKGHPTLIFFQQQFGHIVNFPSLRTA